MCFLKIWILARARYGHVPSLGTCINPLHISSMMIERFTFNLKQQPISPPPWEKDVNSILTTWHLCYNNMFLCIQISKIMEIAGTNEVHRWCCQVECPYIDLFQWYNRYYTSIYPYNDYVQYAVSSDLGDFVAFSRIYQ